MSSSKWVHYLSTTAIAGIISLASCTKDDNDVFNTTPTQTPTTITASEQKLLNLVNNARTQGCNCGNTFYPPVPAVSWNDRLEAAAQSHSDWMNRNNTLSHTGANGSDPGDRITAAGYIWRTYGENVASGYPNEESVVEGWLNSEGHCKNIMNGNFTEMGVAVSGRYWTQELAAPRN
jgi:uncharacterized protein YkwD